MNLLQVGEIVNTHGLRGEVKIVPWTDSPDVFEGIKHIYLSNGNILTVKGVKYQKNNIIVKDYESILDIHDTQIAIKLVKDTFEDKLAKALELTRVTAPLFVEPKTGLNDDLSGVEKAFVYSDIIFATIFFCDLLNVRILFSKYFIASE